MWALLLELGIAAGLVFVAWRVWPKEDEQKDSRDDE
jgi:hypothetical protein